MFGNNGRGNIWAGLISAVIIIVIALVVWLYGGKIKDDIRNKLNNDTEIVQTQEQSNENNVVITLI